MLAGVLGQLGGGGTMIISDRLLSNVMYELSVAPGRPPEALSDISTTPPECDAHRLNRLQHGLDAMLLFGSILFRVSLVSCRNADFRAFGVKMMYAAIALSSAGVIAETVNEPGASMCLPQGEVSRQERGCAGVVCSVLFLAEVNFGWPRLL